MLLSTYWQVCSQALGLGSLLLTSMVFSAHVALPYTKGMHLGYMVRPCTCAASSRALSAMLSCAGAWLCSCVLQ